MYISKMLFSCLPRSRNLLQINRLVPILKKYYTKKMEDDTVNEAPIKYSTSPARKWLAETSRTGEKAPRLWYEPYVILASLSVFMIYFTILREENDVDIELNRSLYSRIEGLEEFQLRQSLEYNLQRNLDTTAIIKRLQEIEQEKQKAES